MVTVRAESESERESAPETVGPHTGPTWRHRPARELPRLRQQPQGFARRWGTQGQEQTVSFTHPCRGTQEERGQARHAPPSGLV